MNSPATAESPLSRYKKPRKLVRWDRKYSFMNTDSDELLTMNAEEKRELAMMALIQNATQRGLDLDWDYAAKHIDPDCTGDALKQQLNKRRERLISDGVAVAPLTSTRPRRNSKATGIVQPHASPWNGPEANLPPFFAQNHGQFITDASSATNFAIPQTPLKRPRSVSPKQTPNVLKKYGNDDDAYVDNDEGEMYNSEDELSDWASRKPSKKKVKRGRPSKSNSLMVKLKTQKKNQVSSPSKMLQSPSSGQCLTALTEGASTDEMTGSSNSYAYSFNNSYPSGVGQPPIGFQVNGPPAMAIAMNQDFGNPHMMNVPQMVSPHTPMAQQYGGACFNNFVNSYYQAGMTPVGQILDTANTQFGGLSANPNTLTWPQNIPQPNYGVAAQPIVQMDANGQYGFQPFTPNLGFVQHGMRTLTHGERIQRLPVPINFNPYHLSYADYGLVTEESPGPQKEWHFPNACVETPTLKDDTSHNLDSGSRSHFRHIWPGALSYPQLGSSTTIEAPVGPPLAVPFEVYSAKANDACSPADSSLVTPQSFAFAQTTNIDAKPVAAPKTPQMNSSIEDSGLGIYESPPEAPVTDSLYFDPLDDTPHDFDFCQALGY